VFQGSARQRFRDDDGAADARAAAALQAFAAAQGSEHAALTALAGIRLLVPVVAALAPESPEPGGQRPAHPFPPAGAGPAAAGPAAAGPAGAGPAAAGAAGGEKASEMALPTLIGRDGRRAIPAFTCLEALARWRPSARPIPADAAAVWRAAVEDSCAVVIDVAGPVPLAVEGARLAALADGTPVPLPHEDPDVRDVVAAVLTESAGPDGLSLEGVGFAIRPGVQGGDLLIELAAPAGLRHAAAGDWAAGIGSAVLDRLGPRLRRGIAIALAP
jgi:SseB protein N-terminal domain